MTIMAPDNRWTDLQTGQRNLTKPPEYKVPYYPSSTKLLKVLYFLHILYSIHS